jgi:hypothetical protein
VNMFPGCAQPTIELTRTGSTFPADIKMHRCPEPRFGFSGYPEKGEDSCGCGAGVASQLRCFGVGVHAAFRFRAMDANQGCEIGQRGINTTQTNKNRMPNAGVAKLPNSVPERIDELGVCSCLCAM